MRLKIGNRPRFEDEVKLRLSPGLVLFFLAPAVGELLSGSSPPAEFFQPFPLLLLAVLYGGGAILCRELALRWGKGGLTLLALGAAYGIVEEGLMVKSFFDPHWVDIGILGHYGRWAGVNWVWALHLTLYHAVFSIAIPVFLVGLLYPRDRGRAWVGRRGFRTLAILFAADVAFGFLFLTPYRPPLVAYLLAALAAAGLVRLARRLPHPWPRPASGRPARARRFVLLGFLGTAALFFAVWALPNGGAPPILTVVAMSGLAAFAAWRAVRLSGHGAWGPVERLALAGGALGFFILLAPLQELDRTRPDNTAGMALVGLGALALLLVAARKARSSAQSERAEAP